MNSGCLSRIPPGAPSLPKVQTINRPAKPAPPARRTRPDQGQTRHREPESIENSAAAEETGGRRDTRCRSDIQRPVLGAIVEVRYWVSGKDASRPGGQVGTRSQRYRLRNNPSGSNRDRIGRLVSGGHRLRTRSSLHSEVIDKRRQRGRALKSCPSDIQHSTVPNTCVATNGGVGWLAVTLTATSQSLKG